MKKYYQSLLIGELREKDSNPRPPAYEAGELPLLCLAMCAEYTARCLRPETMRFKDFYRQPNNVPLLYIFFRFCIRKPQTPAGCVHHVFANFISNLAFAVLLRLPFISASSALACTYRRIIMFCQPSGTANDVQIWDNVCEILAVTARRLPLA